jgi:hypothetical protein
MRDTRPAGYSGDLNKAPEHHAYGNVARDNVARDKANFRTS